MSWRDAQQRLAMAQRLPVAQKNNKLGGMLGQAAGGALGGALGAGMGPLGAKIGAQAGSALGGQLGGTGTINPMQAGTQVLGQNQAGVQDWMRGAMGFADGGDVPFWKRAFQRSQDRAMAPRFDDRVVQEARDAQYERKWGGQKALGPQQKTDYWHDEYNKAIDADTFGRDKNKMQKFAKKHNLDYDSLYEDYEGANFTPGDIKMADLTKSGYINPYAYYAQKHGVTYEDALQAERDGENIAQGLIEDMHVNEEVAPAQEEIIEKVQRAKPRSLGGVDWDIPLGSVGDVNFSTQGQYGMMKGAKDPYTVQLTGEMPINWGRGNTGKSADYDRSDLMSMEEYRNSGPEAAQADAIVDSMNLSDNEKRLMAMFNYAGGPIRAYEKGGRVKPTLNETLEGGRKLLDMMWGEPKKKQPPVEHKFLGGLLGAADKATRAADFVGGLTDIFEKRNKKLTGKDKDQRKKKLRPENKFGGGPIAAPMGQSSFMMQHNPGFNEKVGPLAKTTYKSKGGEVWERSYHDPNKPKPAAGGKPAK